MLPVLQLIKSVNLDNFAHNGYLEFPIPEEVFLSNAITAREDSIVKSLKHKNFDLVANATGSPTIKIIRSLLDQFVKLKIIPSLQGIGIELGAGLGILSCEIIRNNKNVTGIYAVEACKPYAEQGIGLTSKHILNNDFNKVIPCYGTFNDIPIKDGSIDFIIQIESLHHADNLNSPIQESYRVLKEGGYFISIDRAWIDSINDLTIEKMLNHEYEIKWLEQKGFNADTIVTRRDNGEHEYRDCEWKKVFHDAGFTNLVYLPVHPRITIKFLLKRLLTIFKLNYISRIEIPSRPGLFRGIVSKFFHINPLKLNAQLISSHPRPLVVSVWQK